MEKTVLSPDFTIEDIHKLREYNYEVTKHMTDEERISGIECLTDRDIPHRRLLTASNTLVAVVTAEALYPAGRL